MLHSFDGVDFRWIPRSKNARTNFLSRLTTTEAVDMTRSTYLEILDAPSLDEAKTIMETTVEDVEAHRARQAAAEAEAAAAVGQTGAEDDDAAMEESDDEDKEVQERKKREDEERQRELERARAIQASSLEAGGPMKIRTDYVPKLGKKGDQKMTTCTICGQQIAVDELQEHTRIELLDPRWKSQRDVLEARKAQASELQRGANVVSSLNKLARTRVDIFGAEEDEERRKKEEEEERLKRREREKVVWDGHTASRANTLDRFSTSSNIDEQIASIHRAKGLAPYVFVLSSATRSLTILLLQDRQRSHRPRYRSRRRPRPTHLPPTRTCLPPRPSSPKRRPRRRSLLRRNRLLLHGALRNPGGCHCRRHHCRHLQSSRPRLHSSRRHLHSCRQLGPLSSSSCAEAWTSHHCRKK